MHEYTVTGPVANVNQGLLVLDDNQLRRRRGVVVIIGPGDLELEDGTHLCRILAPVQFKHGEAFYTDQPISKLQAQSLEHTGAAYDYEAPAPEQADEEPADDPDKDADAEPKDEPEDYAAFDTEMLDAELAARDIKTSWNAGDDKKRALLIEADADA